MKISNKISIIAGVSTLALVGTAFAAWQFNKDAEVKVNSNVAVTAEAEEGELVANPNVFYLTFDQSGAFWTSSDHSGDDGEISDKITTVALTYTGAASAKDVSDIELKAEYAVDDGIATYLTISGGTLDTPVDNENVKTATYTLPTLAYTAEKPSTKAEYDAMKTALEGKKVAFTFSAKKAA